MAQNQTESFDNYYAPAFKLTRLPSCESFLSESMKQKLVCHKASYTLTTVSYLHLPLAL